MQSPGSFKELIHALKRIARSAHKQIERLERAPRPDKALIAAKRAALARLEADLRLFAAPDI